MKKTKHDLAMEEIAEMVRKMEAGEPIVSECHALPVLITQPVVLTEEEKSGLELYLHDGDIAIEHPEFQSALRKLLAALGMAEWAK